MTDFIESVERDEICLFKRQFDQLSKKNQKDLLQSLEKDWKAVVFID